MKLFWAIFYSIGFGFLIALSLVMSTAVVYAAFHDWSITFRFNVYHEGIAEAIIFPLATIMGIVSVIRCMRRLSNAKRSA